MFQDSGFQTLKALTDATQQRQEIISNNLANIGTENYVRQELDFNRILSDLKSGGLDEGSESIISRARYRDYSKPMTLESELSKLYDNHLRYLILIKAVGGHFEHMRKALEVRAL